MFARTQNELSGSLKFTSIFSLNKHNLLIQKKLHFCLNHLSVTCERVRTEAMHKVSQKDDNRANQLNTNNDAYWQSRGEEDRPEDWEERIEDDQ